jgi:CheY-like chemotaxis protein
MPLTHSPPLLICFTSSFSISPCAAKKGEPLDHALKAILLAEDNPDDALIFETMFKRAKLPYSLHVVEDGQQVIDWLAGSRAYRDRQKHPLPDVLLLDIKMPLKTGLEVPEWLCNQKRFRDVPKVILSSSDEPKDMNRPTELGVIRYFVKSPRLQDVLDYLRGI